MYVLKTKSKKNNQIYIGSTNDLKRRLLEHNNGEEFFTKRYMPWEVLYYEAYSDEHSARIREKRLKHNGNALKELKKRIGLVKSDEKGLPSTTFLINQKSGAGFTLIELMVVVALIFLLSGLIFPTSYSFLQKSAVRDQARNIESSLRKAQAVAIAGRGDSSSGIKFSQTGYTLFEGEFYSSRREAQDSVLNFPVAISVAGAQEIVFQKITGLPIFPGLIGHWDFNEATGSIIYDSSYYLNQDHGTISGTWSRVEGKDDLALELSGNATVTVGHNDSLNPENEITISAWLNTAEARDGGIVRKGNLGEGLGYNLSFSNEGSIVFSLGDGASAQTVSNNYSSELLGEWIYLAAVWDGVQMKQYINGELQSETGSFSGSIASSTDNLIIGEGLIGKIDDVRLYNYALSDEDVKINYLIRVDDIAVGLKFGGNREYIIINSQGKIEAIE